MVTEDSSREMWLRQARSYHPVVDEPGQHRVGVAQQPVNGAARPAAVNCVHERDAR